MYLSPAGLLMDRRTKLPGDYVHVGHTKVHQRVGPGIALVIRQEQPCATVPAYAYESWR